MQPPKPRQATSLPQEYLELLGAISTNFGAVEHSLSLSIWMLLGGPGVEDEEKYQTITAQLSFKQLVWMFSGLHRLRPGADDERIEELCKRAFAAESKRNSHIHSLWAGGPGAATRLKLIARGKLKLVVENHTKDDLIAVANDLAELAYDVTQFTIHTLLPEEKAEVAASEI